jgi:hypothetical protein
VLLASGVVGLFLMLALPGLAWADTAVAEPPTTAAAPTGETTPAGTTTTPPAADQSTPPATDEATPTQPATPTDDGTTTPTDDGAGAAPAPPPSESAPVVTDPASDGSTPAPQPVEAVPTPTITPLPVPPDTPVVTPDPRPATAISASTWSAATPQQATVTLPTGPEDQVTPAVAATAPDAAPPAKHPVAPAAPAPDLEHFTLDPSGPAVQQITAPARPDPVAFGHEAQPPENLTVELVTPQVAAPAGSSLLAVLASYILPGSGPVPPATFMMLVLLGLILAVAYAPRPGGSERIWLSGLLGPGSGHDPAVRRPG